YHFWRSGGGRKREYQCGACRAEGHFVGRNCPKYYPDQVSPDNEPWKPRYRDGKHSFTVPEVKASECPTGYVSRQSEAFLQEFYRRKRLKEVGLTSDTARLPVR